MDIDEKFIVKPNNVILIRLFMNTAGIQYKSKWVPFKQPFLKPPQQTRIVNWKPVNRVLRWHYLDFPNHLHSLLALSVATAEHGNFEIRELATVNERGRVIKKEINEKNP